MEHGALVQMPWGYEVLCQFLCELREGEVRNQVARNCQGLQRTPPEGMPSVQWDKIIGAFDTKLTSNPESMEGVKYSGVKYFTQF